MNRKRFAPVLLFATVVLLSIQAVGSPALAYHSADYAPPDWSINLSELLRAIQFYNTGEYGCDPQGEDGYAPGPGDHGCSPHDADYGTPDWSINLSELLRLIQFYNVGAYHEETSGEDGYAPGPPVNRAPTAFFTAIPATGDAPLEVAFDASASADPDGDPLAFAWNFGDGASANGDSVSHIYTNPGTYMVTLTVSDSAGGLDSASSSIAVRRAQPVDVPPVEGTVASRMALSLEFLYTGTDPVQSGVVEGTIDERKVALLRGAVRLRDGSPGEGVELTVLDHAEYGNTITKADGLFNLVVNGGGKLTLRYAKADHVSVQRTVEVGWLDWVNIADVVLVPMDKAATVVDFSDPIEVARADVVRDSRGDRQSTLLFPQGTSAEMVLPDGTSQPLASITVRATEFTVGDTGPEAMPGELPYGVAYTYAAELSVDEAIAAGAVSVRFDRPIPNYVENFLGFPVGEPVPVYYYDRDRGVWLPMDGGRVIEILSVDVGTGEALVDTDGDGTADDLLAMDGAERVAIAGLYAPGDTLWRVPVTHFSPYDFNWTPVFPEDAVPPDPPPPTLDTSVDDGCESTGSILECENQVLGERIPIAGTSFTLNYRSNRVPGRRSGYTIHIPLTGSSPPLSMVDYRVIVEVAGHRDYQTFPRAADQSYTYTWDGTDIFGNVIQGRVPVRVRVGYTYVASYNCMGLAGGCPPSQPITLWTTWNSEDAASLGNWDARSAGLGGWTLSPHQVYDPGGRNLLLGEGSARRAEPISHYTLKVVAGTGVRETGPDGLPAAQSPVECPTGMTFAPDGTLYFADECANRVRKIDPNGILTTVAGDGTRGFSGDGGPALAAQLDSPTGISLDRWGNLYIADYRNARIRKVSPSGVIETVVGTTNGFSGDGGPAVEAQIRYPYDVEVATDGSLYIADPFNWRVRKVDPYGIISTYVGTGASRSYGDGGPPEEAGIECYGLSIGPEGALYMTDRWANSIRMITSDNLITTVAGGQYANEAAEEGNGGPALAAGLNWPTGNAKGVDGSLLIADTDLEKVKRVDVGGYIQTIAGVGPRFYGYEPAADYSSPDGWPALSVDVSPWDVAYGPDGEIYFTDQQGYIYKLVSSLPGVLSSGFLLPGRDGEVIYGFDRYGRHLQTLHGLTGAHLQTLHYDLTSGLLTAIEDAYGNLTTIERDAAGHPVAFVAPGGQRTRLAVDANGYLASITDPTGGQWSFTYTADGLLTDAANPLGGVSQYEYDGEGRLIQATDPAGGTQTFTRNEIEGGYEVSRTNLLGIGTTYRLEQLGTGETVTTTISDCCGTAQRTDAREWSIITRPDGTELAISKYADPRFGMLAPKTAVSIGLPSGLGRGQEVAVSATMEDAGDPLSLLTYTESHYFYLGRRTKEFDAATRTVTVTTPMGIEGVSVLDENSRVAESAWGDLAPSRRTYDTKGRLLSLSKGSGVDERIVSLEYDAVGNLARVTTPTTQEILFGHDEAGRTTSQTFSDGSVVGYGYDVAGNLTSVATPNGEVHSFSHSPVGRLATYTPPSVPGGGEWGFTYNAGRHLTAVTKPDGSTVALGYDGAGRLTSMGAGAQAISFAYAADTGQLTGVTAADGGTFRIDYDGMLPTSITWNGTVAGSVTYGYEWQLLPTSVTVNGNDTTQFQYDNDGRMKTATIQGTPFVIRRSSTNGLIESTEWRSSVAPEWTTDAYSRNTFGEVIGYAASFGTSGLYTAELTRDPLGRIARKVETIQGAATTYDYSYDPAGRLAEVRADGVPVESYTYDMNGNRTQATVAGAPVTSSYDAQDRITSYGALTYSHTANGERGSRTEGGSATSYAYDFSGNLKGVTLADGTAIEYLLDGAGRRIGKRVNGVLTQGFLYHDSIRPAAEVDETGAVTTRFVYATRFNVPDFVVQGTHVYRVFSDTVGSVRLVVDVADGSIVQRLDYDAFGNVALDTNPGFQPFGFAGGLYDIDTGLVHFGARDYDPESGRWLTKDPILFAGGDVNLFSYARNDPVNLFDPSGKILPIVIATATIIANDAAAVAAIGTAIGVGVSVLDATGVTNIGSDGMYSPAGTAAQIIIESVSTIADAIDTYFPRETPFSDKASQWNDDYERHIDEIRDLLDSCP